MLVVFHSTGNLSAAIRPQKVIVNLELKSQPFYLKTKENIVRV